MDKTSNNDGMSRRDFIKTTSAASMVAMVSGGGAPLCRRLRSNQGRAHRVGRPGPGRGQGLCELISQRGNLCHG